jgi:N6-L-threonylcarbamoyladenine synthase
MIILAIETSCDDTCVAVLEIRNSKTELPFMEAKVKKRTKFSSPFEIRSNVVSSQVKLHAKYGGVYPFLAKKEHQKNLPIVLKRALKEAGYPKINLIAVTVGPGLEPCLWTGINFARELAEKMKLPIVPINHIEAHILANFIGENSKLQITNYKNIFPAICLVVSGGHTQLILMNPVRNRKSSNGVKKFGQYKILGETRDDAAGECFDKAARILGLGFPGGPIISTLAKKHRQKYIGRTRVFLPRPMIYQKNYDFSFSGLKTAVLYDFKKRSSKVRRSRKYIEEMCTETQQAIIDVLIHKTLKVAKDYKAKSIILSGGVAANTELRKQFQLTISNQQLAINFLVPAKNFCTDNAAMVAIAGYFKWYKKKVWKKIKANANLKIDEKL